MESDLTQLYKRLETAQETAKKLKNECELLKNMRDEKLRESITINIILEEREDVLETINELTVKIQNEIASMLGV